VLLVAGLLLDAGWLLAGMLMVDCLLLASAWLVAKRAREGERKRESKAHSLAPFLPVALFLYIYIYIYIYELPIARPRRPYVKLVY